MFDPAQVAISSGALDRFSKLAIQNNGALLKSGRSVLRKPVNIYVLFGVLALFGWIALLGDASAAGRLNDYLGKAEPAELVPVRIASGRCKGIPQLRLPTRTIVFLASFT